MPVPTQAVTVAWADEKKSLIDKVMALKSENQLLVKNLNDQDAQLKLVNQMNHELESPLNGKDLEFATKIDELKKDLQIASEKEAISAKSISDLNREISLLKSQNKQLQTGLAQNEKTNSDSDEGDIYEVERLLDDKLVSERHYLVQWKGFDSTHDSWERESNLRCANILKQYKRSKKN